MWVIRALAVMVVACAPQIDGPHERARALDRVDGDHLSAELRELPGAVRADVALHRPARDAFTGEADPATGSVVVVIDDAADRPAVIDAATRLVRATAPQIAHPEIVVEVGAHRAELATVGPFTVEARSKRLLAAALIAGLALIAALAGFVAWTARPGART